MKKLIASALFLIVTSLVYSEITSIITFPGGSNGDVQINEDGNFGGRTLTAGTNVTIATNSTSITISAIGGSGGASSLEVFSNFDATRTSPTASISLGDAMKMSVSGSTAIITVDFSSVTALGPSVTLGTETDGIYVGSITVVSPIVLSGTNNVESAAPILSLNQNAGTDITNDLEEETHVTEHQDGGADEISVTGLSGLLADRQKIQISTSGTQVSISSGINFIPGSNVTLSGVYNSGQGRVDLTINSSGGGTPGGSNTNVQFNNSGSFGGDSGFQFDNSVDSVTISGALKVSTLNVSGSYDFIFDTSTPVGFDLRSTLSGGSSSIRYWLPDSNNNLEPASVISTEFNNNTDGSEKGRLIFYLRDGASLISPFDLFIDHFSYRGYIAPPSNKVQIGSSTVGDLGIEFAGDVNVGSITWRNSGNFFQFNKDATVPDEVYGAGWNGSLEVPTKNALYDKIETLGVGGGSSSLAVATGSAGGFNGIVSSPTAIINFSSHTFNAQLTGTATSFITLNQSSVTLKGQNVPNVNASITPQNGQTLVYNSSNGLYEPSTFTISGPMFASTNTVTFLNTTSENSLKGVGVGTSTFSANSLTVGKTILVLVSGLYTTDLNSPTMTFKLKMNSVVIATATTINFSGSQSNKVWRYINYITIRSTGTNGTLISNSLFEAENSLGFVHTGAVNTSTQTINTTIDQNLDFTGSLSASGSGEGLTGTNFVIDDFSGGNSGSGGGAVGDNLGSHISTKTITANFGISASTVIVQDSVEISTTTDIGAWGLYVGPGSITYNSIKFVNTLNDGKSFDPLGGFYYENSNGVSIADGGQTIARFHQTDIDFLYPAVANSTFTVASSTLVVIGLNCSGNTNGGALTAGSDGKIVCSDDDGGAGSGDITDVFNCSTGDCNSVAVTDGDLLSFANSTSSSTTSGLILPQTTNASSATASGQITYDTDGRYLSIGNSSSTFGINRYIPISPSRHLYLYEEFFMSSTEAGEVGSNGWDVTLNGTGASLNGVGAETGRMGVVDMDTGTTSTGRSSFHRANGNMFFEGREQFEGSIRIQTLSNATDEYDINFGFGDGTGATTSVDGAFFLYDRETETRWQACTVNNSVSSCTITSSTVDTNWHKFSIVVNNDATSIAFYIDNVLQATNTLNIPKTSARTFTIFNKIIKSAGTAEIAFSTDYVMFYKEIITDR